ncbi:glycerate kinase [Tetragenococcus osmophilus]|uniref:Glycerate kinase n=1 Tax=Tetragenococcus osmophilus TaxID=526944 RepID=A0AA37XMS8_9ENTE|nr:glycerate kinase [Tetragenococcus osmophilus]AYW47588.1 glycerate kinase [Tetragenococcus osmophilus]GMA53213.1 glycerate kinase [Alicyclobacillus contaminans]GMA72815.1 glycerate kinase [Tetragenococcus osmophilus]
MKVVSVIDSFKGCASSEELNEAALLDLSSVTWQEKVNIPIADGGEGTMEAIYATNGGKWVLTTSKDPLGNDIEGSYLITSLKNKKVAVIESAVFIGLQHLDPSEESIRKATSYGLGLVVKDALQREVGEIYVTLGGSATSDGGLGMLAALDRVSYSTKGKENPLLTSTDIGFNSNEQLFKQTKLFAIADVTNPYTGENGFSKVFGPQKGASTAIVKEMETKAKELLEKVEKQYGTNLNDIKGTGAAGGLGAAVVLLGGTIIEGFPTIAEMIGLEETIKEADLIFTGEGKIDAQTENGKVPYGVATLAQKYHVPVIALCGSRSQEIGEMSRLTLGTFCIQLGPVSWQEALDKQRTLKNIRLLAYELSQVLLKGT